MGENKHINDLDAFAKKYVQQIKPAKTSVDFTANLMDKIVAESKQTVFKAEPLISKKGWFAMVVVMLTTLFLTYNSTEKSSFIFPNIDLSYFDKFQFSTIFDSLTISNTTVYIFMFFAGMFFIQVLFLKNYFDKKIE